MAQTQRSVTAHGGADAGIERLTARVGWVILAGIVLFAVGLLNILEGLVALFNHDYYAVQPFGPVLHVNYTTWSWTLLIFGAVLALAGHGVAVSQGELE